MVLLRKIYSHSKEAIKVYSKDVSAFLVSKKLVCPLSILKRSSSRTLSTTVSVKKQERSSSTETPHKTQKLPVPELESSVKKYLSSVQHLLTQNEFENTKQIATEFCQTNGVGPKLQSLLIERAKKTDNWLSQWWLDKVYLEPRYSVVINVNPGTLYPEANYKTLDEKLEFASKYIIGFLQFKKYLQSGQLPVEKLGGAELCMDQYYKLFGTCRIPKKLKDDIKVLDASNIDYQKTNHLTIIVNNRIFSLQILDPNSGTSLSQQEIFDNLKKIVEKSSDSKGAGIGILTSENRNTWADVYSKLIENEENRKIFENIHDSFFVLCLDNTPSGTSKPISRSLASSQILHGNKEFTANRFFDKTIQVIFADNGVWGVNFEHSIAEALPHNLMNDFIYKFLTSNQETIIINQKQSKTNRFKELKLDIPNEVEKQIAKSTNNIYKAIDNLDVLILSFEKFGKNFPKSQRLSPDAFVQIAMQLAFYRAHNKLGNTYESGSLRKFHLGRTDIIRTCSKDVEIFVKSMQENRSESALLFQNAINSHRNFTNNVVNCESFDRHLMGLKLIALENNLDLPALYKDTAYQKACHYHISSSQVSSKFEAVTSYGPAVEDGYGACYNILENKLIFGLSSFKSNKTTSVQKFGKAIEEALIDIQNLLINANK